MNYGEEKGGLEDIESKLKHAIDRTGELRTQAGCYQIVVNDKQNFPWNKVIDILRGYDLWIDTNQESIILKCQVPKE